MIIAQLGALVRYLSKSPCIFIYDAGDLVNLKSYFGLAFRINFIWSLSRKIFRNQSINLTLQPSQYLYNQQFII